LCDETGEGGVSIFTTLFEFVAELEVNGLDGSTELFGGGG